MFVETKKEGEAQTALPSLAGLILWLETQPPDQTYPWFQSKDCMVCRYFKAIGYPLPWEAHRVKKRAIRFHEIFGARDDFDWLLKRYQAVGNGDGEWTYGAALKRARALAD